MIDHRIQRLTDVLHNEDVDVFLATHTADIRWLTGFAGVFDEEQAHLALIARPQQVRTSSTATTAAATVPAIARPLLFTDTRYSVALRQLDTQQRWQILDERRPRFPYVVEKLAEGVTGETSPVTEGVTTETSPVTNAPTTLRIGVEADLRLDSYRALTKALDEQHSLRYEIIELESLVTKLRAIKDPEEIEQLKIAQAITDKAFTHMLDYLKPGLTEREAALELELFMRRSGADGLAFPSIVASGPNSAKPHAVPGDRVFQSGDFVLLDFGARKNDYRADMTRTVVLGEPSEQQRAMYAAVLAAQAAAMQALKPGMTGKEAQTLAEGIIEQHGFGGTFTHGLGHGVGIDIHELPVLAPKVEVPLEAGHVVTVEPGVYLEGIGGVRIEDYGVITAQGFEPFTQSSHELIVL